MTSIFEQVKAALTPRLPELLAELLPGGRVSGREYVCASLQGGAGTSCATNLETGKGSDFARGESWGDGIALAAKVWNMRQGEAAQELARLYHIVRELAVLVDAAERAVARQIDRLRERQRSPHFRSPGMGR